MSFDFKGGLALCEQLQNGLVGFSILKKEKKERSVL